VAQGADCARAVCYALGANFALALTKYGAAVDPLVDEINRIEAAFRQAFGEVPWIFFEPDVR
jgi:hypothetical protein